MTTLSTSWTKLAEESVSYSPWAGTFSLWARIVSTDVANNRTKVAYDWDFETTAGTSVSSYDAQDYVTGAGWNEATYRTYSGSGTLRSGEEWISHNADGTKSSSCSGRTRMGGIGVDTDWVSASFDLPTIPRASVPTASPNPRRIWQGGAPLTVYTNRKSSSFTHTITVSCGSWSTTKTGVTTSTEFNIPYTVGAQFASNTNYATATVTCVTYNGSTNIGTKTCSVTLQINTEQDHANIGTITIEDTNARTSAVTQDDSVYVTNISTLKATIPFTVSGSYTQLASATVTCGTKTQTYTLSGTSQTITFTFDKVNVSSLSVAVSDKRANIVRGSKSWTLLAYSPVTATATVGRTSATGSTAVGQISGVAYGGEYGASTNSLTISYRYKEHDASSWTDGAETFTKSLNSGQQTYTQAMTFSEAFDYQKQYDIQFIVNDLFNTATYTAQLMQGLPILSWDETEVDVFGDLHIHDRDNPTVWQDVMQGFDGILAYGGQKNFYVSFATQTVSGITGTLNADSSYKVVGTATANAWLGYGTTHLSAGDYILSGGKDGVNVMLRDSSGNYVGESIGGNEFKFTVTSAAAYRCYISVLNGMTVNTTVYPMIRDARLASDTFVPWFATRMFVKEETTLTISSGYTTFNYPTGITSTDYFLPIIQPRYSSSSLLGWTGTTQKHGDTACYIYVKQGTTTPANNTKITFDAIWIHR